MLSASRPSGACIKCLLVTFAVASALYVSGPALFWKFQKGFVVAQALSSSATSSNCPPCVCDCPPPLSLDAIAPGLSNLSITDCGKNDSEIGQEMQKQFVELLTEELKLQQVVAEEKARHMNSTLIDAKKSASQYQKEAQKCIAATEICEAARERAEAALRKETKITDLWEQRARQLGWAS
ncbi:hypothetical protein Cni_G02733 [Canna indica]|uniref:Uncharacterized protein n=1 Tax=Canna indica TaxID=4628 RepID=A0AAQ3JSI1_9LILI|nr:hypothetical protein Cni_G02733 [Canna indica]